MHSKYSFYRVFSLGIFSLLILVISGCNIIVKVPDYLKIIPPQVKTTQVPKPPSEFEPKAIKTLTPKDEAKSKYGNPSSYVVFGQRYYVLDSAQGFQQTGIASWYGKKFHGRRTSSGEIYDMYGMTAAHKNLPLPTYLRVRNLQNNRSVIVRVNDRGPFHQGRIIDLSYSAAYQLDMLKQGTARVHIEAIFSANEHQQAVSFPQELKPEVQSERFYVLKKDQQTINAKASSNLKQKASYIQVGAFGNMTNAQNLQLKLEKEQQFPVKIKFLKVSDNVFKRVVIGPIYGQGPAAELFEILSSKYSSSVRYIND